MKYIFFSITAHYGTSQLKCRLSINKVDTALYPFLYLYIVFKNVIAESASLVQHLLMASIPEYYNSNNATLLDKILDAKLDFNFPKDNKSDLIFFLKKRLLFYSGDICFHIEKLNLKVSAVDAFESAQGIIKNLRKSKAI